MADYDNTNRGVLFKNKRKEEGDKKPEYTGSINVDGVEHFLDAWLKTSQAGEKFMSVSVKRKDQQQTPSAPQKKATDQGRTQSKQAPSSGFDDMNDDVPF